MVFSTQTNYILSIFLLVVHLGQTINPTENLILMNLFKILCVVTWAWLFLTFKVMKPVRGKKYYILVHTMAHNSPNASVLFTKYSPRNDIIYWFQPVFSLHISNSKTKPECLISSSLKEGGQTFKTQIFLNHWGPQDVWSSWYQYKLYTYLYIGTMQWAVISLYWIWKIDDNKKVKINTM